MVTQTLSSRWKPNSWKVTVPRFTPQNKVSHPHARGQILEYTPWSNLCTRRLCMVEVAKHKLRSDEHIAYWIPQIISKCVTCRKMQGPPFWSVPTPLLQKSRVPQPQAFQFAVVDYAYPLYARDSEALIFFRRLLSNCLNWKIYCDDHSSLSSTTAVQLWIISYKLHIISLHGKIWTQ